MKKQWKKQVFVSVLILCMCFATIVSAGVFASGSDAGRGKFGGFKMHKGGSTDKEGHEGETGSGEDGHAEDGHSEDSEEASGDADIMSSSGDESEKGHSSSGSSGHKGGSDTHGKPDDHEPGEDEGDDEAELNPFDESIPETEFVDEGKFVTLNIFQEGLADGDEAVICVYKLDDGVFTYKNIITLQGDAAGPYAVKVPVGHECFIESAMVPGFATPEKLTISLGTFEGDFTEKVTVKFVEHHYELEAFTLSFNKAFDPPMMEAILFVDEEILVNPRVSPANVDYDMIRWSSSNELAATVEAGLVTAVGVGESTITADLKLGETVLASAEVEVNVQAFPAMGTILEKTEFEVGQRYPLPMIMEAMGRSLDIAWQNETYVQTLDDGDYLYFIAPTHGNETLPVDADVDLYGIISHDVTATGPTLHVLEPDKLELVEKVVNLSEVAFDLTYQLEGIRGEVPWDRTDLTGFYFTSTDPNIVAVTNDMRGLDDLRDDTGLLINQIQIVTKATANETGYAIVKLRNSQGVELASWGISVIKAEIDLVDNAYAMASSDFMGEVTEEHFDTADEVFITCKNFFDADQIVAFNNETYYIRVTEKGSDGLLGEGIFTFSENVTKNNGKWAYYGSDPIDFVEFQSGVVTGGFVQVNDLGEVAMDGLGKTIAGFRLIDVLTDLSPNTNSSKEVFVEVSTFNNYPSGDEGERPKTYHTNFKIGSAVPTGSIEVDILNPDEIPVENLVGRHVVLTREEFPEGTDLTSVSIYDFYQEDVKTNQPDFLDDYTEIDDIYTNLYVDEVKLFGRIAERTSSTTGETELYVAWDRAREVPLKIGGYFLLMDYKPYKTNLQSTFADNETMLKEVHLKKPGEVVEKTVIFYE
jgi:hypothetical protein